MSRINKQVIVAKKPYCKVCHDAGKPESEYSSHWVKSLPDKSGKSTITCPTLLSNECRYCFKTGHTAKFCPILEQNKKVQEKAERIARKEEAQKKVKVEKTKSVLSGFNALAEDSDSEGEEVKVHNTIVDEFPILGNTHVEVYIPTVKQEAKFSWANAVSKPKHMKEEQFVSKTVERTMAAKKETQPVSTIPIRIMETNKRDYSKEVYTKNWADWSDDDDSELEDDFVPQNSAPPLPYKQTVSVAVTDYDSDW
jgi:hypothetical protein